MTSALVTGATGFLGRTLSRQLVEDGWTVTATHRQTSNRDVLADLDVDWALADVLDESAVRDAVEGHDYVFHLAGIGLLDGDDDTVWEVNVDGTRNVLDAARDTGVERVVFTSTAGTRRSDNGPATEDDVARPLGTYQQSKARAETLVDEYVADGGDAVTVHPTSIFGPGDESFTARLLSLVTDPKMVAYLPGGVSFVDVRDVARGIVSAATEGEPGEHYILGGENLTFGEALQTLAHLAGGTTPRVRVPPAAIQTAGYGVGLVNDVLGTRMFPVNPQMARLSTQRLFYSSAKASSELGYEYAPLRSYASDAIDWYLESER